MRNLWCKLSLSLLPIFIVFAEDPSTCAQEYSPCLDKFYNVVVDENGQPKNVCNSFNVNACNLFIEEQKLNQEISFSSCFKDSILNKVVEGELTKFSTGFVTSLKDVKDHCETNKLFFDELTSFFDEANCQDNESAKSIIEKVETDLKECDKAFADGGEVEEYTNQLGEMSSSIENTGGEGNAPSEDHHPPESSDIVEGSTEQSSEIAGSDATDGEVPAESTETSADETTPENSSNNDPSSEDAGADSLDASAEQNQDSENQQDVASTSSENGEAVSDSDAVSTEVATNSAIDGQLSGDSASTDSIENSTEPSREPSSDDSVNEDSDEVSETTDSSVDFNSSKPLLILDTDMDLDIDDCGTLGMLNAMADNGEVEILGVMHDSSNTYGVGTIDAINTYYGRPNIPIGSYKGSHRSSFTQPVYKTIAQRYSSDIKTKSQAMASYSLYRKLLAKAPDKSVTIVSVGFVTNLSILMNSNPDQYSNLNGIELVRKKVKLLVQMAGSNNDGFNLYHRGVGVYSENAFKKWPTEVVISHSGSRVFTGAPVSRISANPVSVCFRENLFKKITRQSWDQIALLYAVRGNNGMFNEQRNGYHYVGRTKNSWRASPNRGHHVVSVKNRAQMTSIIDQLMSQLPKPK